MSCNCNGRGNQTGIEAARAASGGVLPSATVQMPMGGTYRGTYRVTDRKVQLRIAGGGSRGVLELRIDGGRWDAVCDNSFDNNAATAFCRELGCARGTQYDATHGDDFFAADNIACPAGATSVSQCSSSTSPYSDSCADYETVGIECSGSSGALLGNCAAGSCTCDGNWAGEVCEYSCGDHGVSDGHNCVCTGEWIGERCDTECDCSGQGTLTSIEDARAAGSCAAGGCACGGNFIGESCELECGCSGHGNQTAIEAARTADDCSAGACTCESGYVGQFCEYTSNDQAPANRWTVPAQCAAGMGSHGVVYN
eukprot:COSAG04_NODE_6943_length_1223_cov_1.238434_1_plen_310_part_10